MRLTLKQLKQLSVATVSGAVLGFVSEVVLDTDGQMIVQYVVKPSLLHQIRPHEYLISRDQIVRFEDKRVLVDDSVAKLPGDKDKQPVKPLSPEPIAMRKVG